MFDPFPVLWLIPALPLAASALTAFLGPRLLRQQSHWPCIVAAIGYSPSPTAVVIRSSGAQERECTSRSTPPDAKFVPLFGTRGLRKGRR